MYVCSHLFVMYIYRDILKCHINIEWSITLHWSHLYWSDKITSHWSDTDPLSAHGSPWTSAHSPERPPQLPPWSFPSQFRPFLDTGRNWTRRWELDMPPVEGLGTSSLSDWCRWTRGCYEAWALGLGTWWRRICCGFAGLPLCQWWG